MLNGVGTFIYYLNEVFYEFIDVFKSLGLKDCLLPNPRTRFDEKPPPTDFT